VKWRKSQWAFDGAAELCLGADMTALLDRNSAEIQTEGGLNSFRQELLQQLVTQNVQQVSAIRHYLLRNE